MPPIVLQSAAEIAERTGLQRGGVDFGQASRVVEALARKGERDVGRILDLLAKEVEDFENDPRSWLERGAKEQAAAWRPLDSDGNRLRSGGGFAALLHGEP
jgi:hypothetical protein